MRAIGSYMTKNILILFAFVLLASTSNWVPLYTDITLTGQGTEDSPLKVDTSRVATAYDMVVSAAGTSSITTTGTVTSGIWSSEVQLVENTPIKLDPAGSADGKYSGTTILGTGGATIAFGDLVTLDKDDSRWELVDISVAAAATGDARGIFGVAVTSSTDGTAITVLLNGTVRADANFPALTIGASVYASTAGDVVVTQPSTTDYVIRVIGFALTADEIYFNPSNDYITKI